MHKRNKNKAEYSRINPMLLGKEYYKKRLSEMVVHVRKFCKGKAERESNSSEAIAYVLDFFLLLAR